MTFTESDHPRGTAGTFTEKAQSAPAVALEAPHSFDPQPYLVEGARSSTLKVVNMGRPYPVRSGWHNPRPEFATNGNPLLEQMFETWDNGKHGVADCEDYLDRLESPSFTWRDQLTPEQSAEARAVLEKLIETLGGPKSGKTACSQCHDLTNTAILAHNGMCPSCVARWVTER
jgi:hypothetical protein